MQYLPIIGLEIHIQLKTKSKMFCSCDNSGEDKAPNSTICPICLGYPGVLPVINQKAIEWTVLMGLALKGKISEFSRFDRKNYFYPDLPKGYQISQYDRPLVQAGYLELQTPQNEVRKIRINRIHLEEDAAKLIHEVNYSERIRFAQEKPHRESYPLESEDFTFIDFNRVGTPLLEIVTEPDIRSSQEAKLFLQELRLIVRYLNISDAEMEKGHLRCDANISLNPVDEFGELKGNLTPKTEIKNLNSFKAVERALEYEIKRQTRLWQEGNPPKEQSTRGWDEDKGITIEQRKKEEAYDYRYFPEPDLPPLRNPDIEKIKLKMRELPQDKRRRFMEQYGFSSEETKILTEDRNLSYYTEQVISELKAWLLSLEEVEGTEKEIWKKNKKQLVKLVANWLINKLGGLMTKENLKIKDLKITPENFAEFITLIYQNRISSFLGQKILLKMFQTGTDPSNIITEESLEQVSEGEELDKIIEEVIKGNPQVIQDFKKGKINALQFLIGQIMKQSRGRANPKMVSEMLKRRLEE